MLFDIMLFYVILYYSIVYYIVLFFIGDNMVLCCTYIVLYHAVLSSYIILY